MMALIGNLLPKRNAVIIRQDGCMAERLVETGRGVVVGIENRTIAGSRFPVRFSIIRLLDGSTRTMPAQSGRMMEGRKVDNLPSDLQDHLVFFEP